MAIATCLARFSAITLLLWVSIQSTISASGGDATAAMVAAPCGAAVWLTAPRTRIPSPARNPAKACAASAAGVNVRARKFSGSLASCGAPLAVSLP